MDKKFKLYTRDEFRENCLKRDNYKCLMCDCVENLVVHHILERRLFSNGGYYLENGATVCEKHHIEAEQTILSCSVLREKASIKEFPIPDHLYKDQDYDKWGNYILSNGQRLKGELFDDESVQKIINPVLYLFTDQVKYSRTYHLPWSNPTKDDRIQTDLSSFIDQDVVVTVKMDGENTTMYSNYIHARSTEYNPHPSRSWIKAFHSKIQNNIPEKWRICGENLYAQHTIKYDNLEHYFQVFSIWNDKNICLSWSETVEWLNLLDLISVPVLYQGKWNEKLVKELYKETYQENKMEGYIVRLADSFHYKNFRKSVVKFVRKNFVDENTHHWKFKQVIPNGLRNA